MHPFLLFGCCFAGVDLIDVAFFAALSTDIRNVPVETILKFDFVSHNYGNGYDRSTGIFTCPTSGMYLFLIFIDGMEQEDSVVSLVHNGVPLISALAEPSFNGQDIIGANAIAFRLYKGDRVWIKISTYPGSFWKVFTTFSGLLIHR